MYTAPLRTCDICFVSNSVSDAAHDAAPETESDLSKRTSLSKDRDTSLVIKRNCATLVGAKTCELPVVLSVARHVPMVLRASSRQRRRCLHPRRIFKGLLHQSESTCAQAFFFSPAKCQCKDASGIHDTSLLFSMECDADIRKNSYSNFMPSGGTAMFQGTSERVTKEPTVLAPSTMEIKVVAPPD